MVRLAVMDPLFSGACVTLTPPQHHYVCHVMRVRWGGGVEVFNGREGLWEGTLEECGRGARIVLGRCVRAQPSARDPLWVAFGIIKRWEILVEKATELGVTDVVPLLADRCNVRHFSPDRARKIMLEACEQSERLDWMTFHPIMTVPEAMAVLPPGCVVLDPQAQQEGLGPGVTGILCGPEGGWSPREQALWQDLKAGTCIQAARLPGGVLRAETAALVGVTLARFGSAR